MIEYDDDTHFCLKCHSTILGLENYINHRKSGCSKSPTDPSKSPLPSQLLPPDEIGLKADDFFSSLELRSSSKKPVQQSTSGKNFSGILTRSKTTAVIQATATKEQPETSQSKSGKNAWIGGHQLKELGHGDNQSKLIKAVANLERRKEDPPQIGLYEDSDEESDDYDYEDEDSSEDEDDPPRHHTGGKWKPSSPIQWSRDNRDWNAPPPTYTGGKWKPSSGKRPSSPPSSYTKGKWKPVDIKEVEYDNVPPPTFTGSKWVSFKKPDYQDIPPPSHTKGKWKPRGDIEDDSPPPGHTKGKWKPRMDADDYTPPPTYTKGKWKPRMEMDEDIPPPNHTKGKWKPKANIEDVPLPTHTKGKWKPRADEDDIPPPSHTKGKWKPRMCSETETIASSSNKLKLKSAGKEKSKKPVDENMSSTLSGGKYKPKSDDSLLTPERPDSAKLAVKDSETKVTTEKKSIDDEIADWISPEGAKSFKITDDSPLRKYNGAVQYWCSPCNRRLASKIVYERHLKSDLHFKRTKPEGEFDEGAFIKKKKTKPTCSVVVNRHVHPEVPKKRIRKKTFERCGVCQSRVNKYLMGKHLISHYHCRKGDISTDIAKTMVLDNIYGIVLESPFQCCVCKFYCNTHEDFLDHWRSSFHSNNDDKFSGYYYCTFCRHTSNSSEGMLKHLNSPEHLEVVSVINRSVPITIKKITEIPCLTCGQTFTLNIQLLNHCRKLNHNDSNVNIFKKDFYTCKDCDKTFFTGLAIQRHRKKMHRHEYFFCSACSLKFSNALQAKEHRKSGSHRYTVLEKKKPEGGSLRRRCEYCEKYFANFLLLKEHLKKEHPEHKVRCPHCGANFTINQELTNHLRSKSCKFEESSSVSDNSYRCEKCPFSSNSTSELLFHVALHNEPIIMYPMDADGNLIKVKAVPRYKCPVCEKIFPKSSLQAHLRLHTQEKPYSCKMCDASFARKNNLLYHVKNHYRKGRVEAKKEKSTERSFLCSSCGAGFAKKYTLQQHMLVHSGKICKCPEIGCFYTARKMSEIKEHFKIHCDARDFCCNLCEYKGKTKSQLKRHLTIHEATKKFQCNLCTFTCRTSYHLKRHSRLHTGAKPFSCPHCEYKCNTLGNLRKHVLVSTKHPGRSLYECKFCTSDDRRFQANFAKDFKNHLLLNHTEVFGNGKDAASYIAGIYEAQDDNIFLTDVIDSLETGSSCRCSISQSVKSGDPSETILKLKTNEDPVVTQLMPPTEPSTKDRSLDQMLPMFIIPKEEIASETWNLVGRFDVEESGTLVPFQTETGDVLFQEHF